MPKKSFKKNLLLSPKERGVLAQVAFDVLTEKEKKNFFLNKQLKVAIGETNFKKIILAVGSRDRVYQLAKATSFVRMRQMIDRYGIVFVVHFLKTTKFSTVLRAFKRDNLSIVDNAFRKFEKR
jgi:hypothetical protein